MHHCLSKEELEKLIELKANFIDKLDDEDGYLNLWIDNAENWRDELAGLSYFLSKILEIKLKKGIDCQNLIRLIHDLPDQMWLHLQQFDVEFVQYMLAHVRTSELSLEENLIELQNGLGEHQYGSAFRH